MTSEWHAALLLVVRVHPSIIFVAVAFAFAFIIIITISLRCNTLDHTPGLSPLRAPRNSTPLRSALVALALAPALPPFHSRTHGLRSTQ